MPEGDSLVRLAQRLRPVVVGTLLSSSDFRVPALATTDLAGAQMSAVTTRGKYLLLHLDLPSSTAVLLSHLGMDGSWQLQYLDDADGPTHPQRQQHRNRPRRFNDPAGTTRVVLTSPTFRLVGVSLKEVHLLTPAHTERRLAFFGPDLLDPDWGAEHLQTALTRMRAQPQRPIGTALLDQRNIAGIGNIYRCETLLLTRIDPRTPVGALDDDAVSGLAGVLELARALMLANIDPDPPSSPGAAGTPRSASSRRTTTGVTPDPHAPFGVRVLDPQGPAARRLLLRGTAPYWVYGREREGCLRCGGPVRREEWGDPGAEERVLYWCPRCQSR